VGESCPLCGAPLHPEQEWCLRCGAAARTRLAASPGWRAPIVALAVVVALSLGVLAAALVKLAGDSGHSTAAPTTTTVTSTPAAGIPTTTTPTASVPGAALPGASTTATTPATALPGAGAGGTGKPTATTPGATTLPLTTGAGTSSATVPGAVKVPGLPAPRSTTTTPKR
jgi:hypothetical protein